MCKKIFKKIFDEDTTWKLALLYIFALSAVMLLAAFSLYFTDKQPN